MTTTLSLTVGQHSRAGRKAVNQDRCGVFIPDGLELTTKGIVTAIADGISSSDVSQEASSTAISSFIEDYYATPDSWSVVTSAERVLQSINSCYMDAVATVPIVMNLKKAISAPSVG